MFLDQNITILYMGKVKKNRFKVDLSVFAVTFSLFYCIMLMMHDNVIYVNVYEGRENSLFSSSFKHNEHLIDL